MPRDAGQYNAGVMNLICFRFKKQYQFSDPDMNRPKSQSDVISYLGVPLGLQINIMLFIFPIKDFIGISPYASYKPPSTLFTCPQCRKVPNMAFQSEEQYVVTFPH